MQVWRGIETIPQELRGTAVTIGNFDGVHEGHRAVLAELVARARAVGLPAVALTFDPHPALVHRPDAAPELLCGLTDRLELLAQAGLDATLVVHYTAAFAAQSAHDFAQRYLADALRAQVVVVGEDVRFGAGNCGDGTTMRTLGAELGFETVLVSDVPADGSHRRSSSTWVRELLTAGDVAGAAALLGRPHRMRGAVVHGFARGREMGFPTANLAPDSSGTVPADGVYAGWLSTGWGTPAQQRMAAAISIGTNPTFAGRARVVEAHVLGRTDLDLYHQEVVVEFVELLRPTLKFESMDALVEQMNADVDRAADLLGVPRPAARVGLPPAP